MRLGLEWTHLRTPEPWVVVFLGFSAKHYTKSTSKKTAFRVLHNLVEAVALAPHSHVTRQILSLF